MTQLKLRIGKIHCSSCTELIKDILEDLGIEETSFEDNIATIKYDHKKIKSSQIKKEIIDCGYTIL